MPGNSQNKTAFIDFLMSQDVLKFGDFTLKSGRRSPYFFNLGEVASGTGYAQLGQAYADAILAAGVEFDVLFGPAYKGIPIATATAIALAARGMEVGVAYNRKEAKTHGEGGMTVGAALSGKVLLIDDVLTSGKAIREALAVLPEEADIEIAGAVIAMDRQEIVDANAGSETAVSKLSQEISAPVISIANMQDLIDYLDNRQEAALLERMREYQNSYCALA